MQRTFLLPAGTALALALSVCVAGTRAGDQFEFDRDNILSKELSEILQLSDPSSPTAANRPDRIRLFRMVPGFLGDPLGMQDDDPVMAPDGTPLKADDGGPSWIQLAIGSDNPFFDVRLPGDPGGIGYTRMQTQLQVLDLPSTSCTLGFQAVTPAGAQQGGVEDGATVLSPAFGLFHALDDGTAFQGFVAKDLHVTNAANLSDTLSHGNQFARSVQYGMAVQRPIMPEVNNVYFFVEALGRYRYDSSGTPAASPTTSSSLPTWDVLPGMHMKLSDSWWLSGGLILPVNNGTRTIDTHLWQFTASFQF